METPEPPVILLAEQDDPWVKALAGLLPDATIRIDCAGELPETWPNVGRGPSVLVLHRRHLRDADADRLRRARRTIPLVRVVLIVGPHVRYDQLQRWSLLVDGVVPEVVAREVLPSHIDRLRSPGYPVRKGPVCVVSSDFELRSMLVEVCRRAGFEAVGVRDWSQAPVGVPALWDVPVLEPGWPRRLAVEAASRRVVALIGFADQPLADQAREHGAAACLDLPCDPADLLAVLERVAGVQELVRLDGRHAEQHRPVGAAGARSLARRGGGP
jgi:hypothetical protein